MTDEDFDGLVAMFLEQRRGQVGLVRIDENGNAEPVRDEFDDAIDRMIVDIGNRAANSYNVADEDPEERALQLNFLSQLGVLEPPTKKKAGFDPHLPYDPRYGF